jgi:spore coat protein CotH
MLEYNVFQDFTSIFNNQSIDANDEFHRLFTDNIKHNITIEISKDEWEKLNADMLSYAEKYEDDLRSDTYFKANLIYTDIHGTIISEEIGFRTRGNNSRILLQNDDGTYNLSHFKIKFNETFDYIKESKNYTLLKDRKVFDLKELNLKYNSNNDLSNVSELHSYNIMNRVGIPAPLITLTELTIKIENEQIAFGIYSVIEPIDKEFIDKRYSKEESQGNLYKCLNLELAPASLESLINPNQVGIKNAVLNYRPTYDLKTNKKAPNYSDIKQFINSINSLHNDDFRNFIDNFFDVDSFLRLLAINALIGNSDDYRGNGNNYYLYLNNKSSKFVMIPYDIDQSLGVDISKFTMYSDIYHWRNNSILFTQNEVRPLSDKILLIPEYQDKYEYYLTQFIEPDNHIFTYESFLKTFNKYKDLYNTNVEFSDIYAKNYYNIKITNIKEQLYYYEFNPYQKRGDIS